MKKEITYILLVGGSIAFFIFQAVWLRSIISHFSGLTEVPPAIYLVPVIISDFFPIKNLRAAFISSLVIAQFIIWL